MYTIGIDISTTSTGFAIFKERDLIHSATLTASSSDEMLTVIKAKIRKAMGNIKDVNNVRFVLEDYTDTILRNDRTGVAAKIVKIKNDLKVYLWARDAGIALVLPWSWRKCYNLNTRVLPINEQDARLSRACGHNILKDESIEFFKTHLNIFGISVDVADKMTDDEIEAALIAKSWQITRISENREYFEKIKYVDRPLLDKYIDTLPTTINISRVWN